MQKIVICTEVAGFVPERSLLRGLFRAHPDAFEDPFSVAEFGLEADSTEDDIARTVPTAVLSEGQLHFMQSADWVRALPWLVAEVQNRGGNNCSWRNGTAKVVDVPDDVKWYIHTAEDGSESVHEKHRIWA